MTNIMDPLQQPAESKFLSTGLLIGMLVALVVIIAAGYGIWRAYGVKSVPAVAEEGVTLRATIGSGDYEGALKQYRAMVSDSNLESDRFARATINVASARLKSPDLEERLGAVRDLKKAAEDAGVSPELKARTITMLALAYQESGEDKDVYFEVFSGTYKAMRDEVRPVSMRNMLLWSYSIYPTARASIAISLMYVKDILRKKFPPVDVSQAAIDSINVKTSAEMAKKYFSESETLFKKEEDARSTPDLVTEASYRYWHTFIIGMLAYLEGGTYKDRYSSEYEAFIDYFEKNGNAEASQYLPFAYWNYATLLVLVDKDETKAKSLLNTLVEHVKNDPNPAYNEFLLVMRNHMRKIIKNGNVDFNTISLDALNKISPEFKQLVTEAMKANGSAQ